MLKLKLVFIPLLFFVCASSASDQELDQQQASQLRRDLEFDVDRRNEFKNHRKNNRVFESEREKGMSIFLEEQEKWDITREKGLPEQRASRAKEKHMDETSPEYFQDLKKKQTYEKSQELSRKKLIQTRDQIVKLFKSKVQVTEEEELDIYNSRPRYSLRDRAKNKWVGKGSKSGVNTGGAASSPGFLPPTGGGAMYDYPPPPVSEYVPTDNFEELPPPPPMMPYDNYSNPNMGDPEIPFFSEGGNEFDMPPPGFPPPAPEGGWDF